MAESEATIGYGTTFKYRSSAAGASPLVWTSVGEVVSIRPPQTTRGAVQVTHLNSPNKAHEYRPGMIEPGEAEATFNFTPDAYVIAGTLLVDDELGAFQIEYPDGSTETFDGFTTGKPSEPVEVEGVRRFSLPIQVSGLPVYAAA